MLLLRRELDTHAIRAATTREGGLMKQSAKGKFQKCYVRMTLVRISVPRVAHDRCAPGSCA